MKENGTDTNEEEMVQATAIIFAPYCIERNKVRLFSPHRVDRWSPIPQFDDEVAPKAPKRPVRRVDDFDFQPIHEEEGKAEGKEAIIPEEDEDEESIVSLLSGVMAMRTSEREASKLIKADASPSDRRGCIKTGRRPSPTTAGGNSVSKPRTSVAFDRITIREYERTLGDNPSCTSGPPITIGWICLNSYECALDEYERTKSRRNKRDFYLSAAFRNDLLTQEWGCPEKDIRKAVAKPHTLSIVAESQLSQAPGSGQRRPRPCESHLHVRMLQLAHDLIRPTPRSRNPSSCATDRPSRLDCGALVPWNEDGTLLDAAQFTP